MIQDTVYDALIRHLMGPLVRYYDDPTVTEIMINGPNEVFVDGRGGVQAVTERLEDSAALRALARVILQFSGKRLDPLDLSLEARTPSRARVHIVQDPAARAGITLAIRQFAQDPPSIEDLEASGSLSGEAIAWLREQVLGHRNIIISGGTGTGKTTLLGILCRMMDPAERILTIEDVAELDLRMPHVVAMESQMPDAKGRGGITIRDLFRAALRMRPDRIIVGECRGGEALDMIQAMNSGHAGSLSTVHADDPGRALSRLETLCLMSDADVPLIAVRRQIVEAIDLVVQVRRTHGRRLVMEIAETVKDTEATGGYAMTPVFLRRDADAPLERV
ncbi:CpaF family protein [Alphaproteobacteria bacterium GH1-50]|uniref:CpaF family protein n=1 Tax=Kangsaoukella pontilimi TaxID=2691042 RepID=A0A7C9IJ70_9RHOB|nr:ATPase, T2SS/T4P/T4SS family [Kangsaoukella pontilimi]MXQ09729.1 CpaF family protein [Kangsaoukella pontilimi]